MPATSVMKETVPSPIVAEDSEEEDDTAPSLSKPVSPAFRTLSAISPIPAPPRTPTPVQSFLRDAGLGSAEATPQHTPRQPGSPEQQQYEEEQEEEEVEEEEEEEIPEVTKSWKNTSISK